MKKVLAVVLLTLGLYPFLLAQNTPPHELRDLGETVLDTGTLLQWVKDPSVFGQMTWEEAQVFVENLEYGGFSDWRLPSGLNPDGTVCDDSQPPVTSRCSQTEMGHIYDAHRQGSGFPPFENVSYLVFWTATEYPSDATQAMTCRFDDGTQYPVPKVNTVFVWPVRKARAKWIHHPLLGWILLFFILAVVSVSWLLIRRRNLPKLPA